MRRLVPWLLLAPALLLVTLFLLLPVGDTALMTLGSTRPFSIYRRFFADAFNRDVVVGTIETALISTLVSLVFGFVAAYAVAAAPRAAKGMLIVAAIFPLLTGTVVRSFAWIIILGRFGLVNNLLIRIGLIHEPAILLYTRFSVLAGLVYLFTPLMIVSLVGVLENIDHDLLRAASSLGARPRAVFLQILVPLATPGIIVGSVLVFTGSFAAFATPQLLGGDRQTMLATLLYQKALVSFDWVGASTIAMIMMVITLTVLFAMTRLARRLNPLAA